MLNYIIALILIYKLIVCLQPLLTPQLTVFSLVSIQMKLLKRTCFIYATTNPPINLYIFEKSEFISLERIVVHL